MDNLISQIEAELDRLDASDDVGETGGIVVTTDDNLPEGHVRLEDEGAAISGPASVILEALKAVKGDEQATGWESAWAALSHERHAEITEG